VPRFGALSLLQKPLQYRGIQRISMPKGGFEFSEGTSVKCIFNVEIEKLRAEFFLHVEKIKIVLGEKLLIERSNRKNREASSVFINGK
jgi:hypothetical protein